MCFTDHIVCSRAVLLPQVPPGELSSLALFMLSRLAMGGYGAQTVSPAVRGA